VDMPIGKGRPYFRVTSVAPAPPCACGASSMQLIPGWP